MKNKFDSFNILLTLLGGAALLFIVAPILGLYLKVGLPELKNAFYDQEIRDCIWLTLWSSMLATLFFSLLAIPFSYLLAKKNFPFKKTVNAIVDLPVVIPHSAAGLALLIIVGRHSMIGKTFDSWGISFVGNEIGIMLAMAFVSIPFLINSARDGFSAVPTELEKAALNLGATPAKVFFTISLPLAIRPILSGLILMFARGMSEFGAVIILAYHPMIAPIMIFDQFSNFGLEHAKSLAVLFITISLLVFVILKLLSSRREDVNS